MTFFSVAWFCYRYWIQNDDVLIIIIIVQTDWRPRSQCLDKEGIPGTFNPLTGINLYLEVRTDVCQLWRSLITSTLIQTADTHCVDHERGSVRTTDVDSSSTVCINSSSRHIHIPYPLLFSLIIPLLYKRLQIWDRNHRADTLLRQPVTGALQQCHVNDIVNRFLLAHVII